MKKPFLSIIIISLAITACENPIMRALMDPKTVYFDSNGGSHVPSKTLIKGEKLSEPKTPVKAGYYFNGWFEDNNTFNKRWSFNKEPDGDMTLYASWYIQRTQPPNQTPTEPTQPPSQNNSKTVVEDYTIEDTEQVYDGSPKVVTITAKEGKSTGEITVYYNDVETPPSAPGTYKVTFNVGEVEGWNAASGLQAGTLVIYFDDATKLKSFLISLSTDTTSPGRAPSNPITIPLKVNDLNNIRSTINSVPNVYVKLDFSGSTFTAIGNSAFSDCLWLTSITIPNSVESIEDSAFSNSGLTSVTMPNSVQSIGDFAFSACESLTSVNIPNSVQSIGIYAFSSCEKLISVNIPDNVTNIGENTFRNCTSLTSVILPDSVESIEQGAFKNCTNLTSIIIPDSVESIGDSAFSACENLVSVALPTNPSFTKINESTFSQCLKLASINIPNSVTNIGSNAFADCSNLTNVIIPASVTIIDEEAFMGCTSLISINIPASVNSIGASAFSRCTGLTSVTIQTGVTSIGDSAFYRCTGLTSVTIQAGVSSIGSNTFAYCSNLTSVTIPASVTSIGASAFSRCTGLNSVTFATGSNIAEASFGSNAFPEGLNGQGGNTLKTSYADADPKAGIYKRDTNGFDWDKQQP